MPGEIKVGTSATLSIRKSNAGTYPFRCTVTDSKGTIRHSNLVELHACILLYVNADPLTTSCFVDQDATFTASVGGGHPPYTYKWYEGSTVVGTSAALSTHKSQVGTYTFRCVVTDARDQTKTTNNVELRVKDRLRVNAMPFTTRCYTDQSVTFTATAYGGTPPYTYNWFDGSSHVLVGTSAELSICKSNAGGCSFYCKVTDSAGTTMETNYVLLTVLPAWSVSATPSTISSDVGQSETFTATASGGMPPYQFVWFEGSNPLKTSPTLLIAKHNAGTYSFYCKVTDSTGSIHDSNPVTLEVKETTSMINAYPSVYTSKPNEPATFYVPTSGGGPTYTYKWYEGSTVIGTSDMLSISKDNPGTYTFYCVVTDSAGSTYRTNDVMLVVQP